MALNMTPELWKAICQASAMYPTCTIHLHQHEWCVNRFTVEHGPGVFDVPVTDPAPPRHVQPHLQPAPSRSNHRP
jgi:hypothetical protein